MKIIDEIMAQVKAYRDALGAYDFGECDESDVEDERKKIRAMVEDAVSVPSGMVLVPIELTAEMAAAMFMKANLTIPERYKAMLSASPRHSEIEDLPELLKPQSPEY